MSETRKSHRQRVATEKARDIYETPTDNPRPRPPKSKPRSKPRPSRKGKQKAAYTSQASGNESTGSEGGHTREQPTTSKNSRKRKRQRRQSTTSIEEIEVSQWGETEIEELELEDEEKDGDELEGDEAEPGRTSRMSKPSTSTPLVCCHPLSAGHIVLTLVSLWT